MRAPAALVALMMVTSAAVAEGPRFTVLPLIIRAMNADGTSVAANGPHEGYSSTGHVFNLLDGTTHVLTNHPHRAAIVGMSSNGQFFSGQSVGGIPPSSQAFRIAADGNHTPIGKRSDAATSRTIGISGDGSVVAGLSDLYGDSVITFPFRWTPQTGREEIGPANGLFGGQVHDISRDGSTIVGTGNSTSWVWREGSGFSYLPTLAGLEGTTASAVSADGSIIVGSSNLTSNPYDKLVVRWIGSAIHAFPMPPGMINPGIEDVSDDGNVIVGSINIPGGGGTWGMICTPELGMMFASDYLALHGLTLPSGVGIRRIYNVSANGMTFAGHLTNNLGFVATVPAPASAALFAAASLFAARRRRG